MNLPLPEVRRPGMIGTASVLEHTRTGLCQLDASGRLLYVNAAAAQLLGAEPARLLGLRIQDLVPLRRADGPPRQSESVELLLALREGRAATVEGEPITRIDGQVFQADCLLDPVRVGGVLDHFILSLVDVSKRWRAEEHGRRVRCELEQRVASRSAELREALDELNAVTERLRELSAHAECARENDRSRIAREIHDELGSVLVALKLDLSWLGNRLQDRAELVTKTVSMRRLLDNAVVEVGRIITDLRPSILDHQGLWAAMEWHAQEAIRAAGLGGGIDLVGVSGYGPPEGALATAAYRIFQEMLNNVARHAHATSVDIRVGLEDGGLEIVVEDNGRGISADALSNPRSYGLVGMYERARHFGGRVSIAARGKGGTRVRAWLPFEPAFPLTAHAAMEIEHDSPADL